MKKLLLVFILFGVIASNAQQVDLLKEQLKNASADTTKLRILNELTENTDDFNVWPDYAKQAYELALKIAANPDSVIRKAGKKGLSAALNNMGVYNNLTGNRSAAHEMFMQSLKIREETGDDAALSETYHNLASLYFDLEEFDLAKSFFEKSARLSEKLNDSINLAVSRNYLGMIALRKKDNEKAKEYFQQSMKMFETTGDSLSRLKTMVNLGAILYQENKLDSALKLFNEAYKINIIHNDPIKSIILINIGRVYFKQGKTDAALKYAGDALTGAKSEGIPSEIASAEYLLSEIYNASGRYQDAYSHLMMYNSLKEVLSDENVQRVIVAERVKHDYEKKIAEEQLEQKRQREIAEQEINKQKIIIEAFVAGAFLLALLIVVLIRNNRQQRKSRMELQQAYSDLKRTQQQLILQEKNASLAQFTAGIAHELKNPLNFVANFSLLSNELLQEMESASDAKEKEEIQQQLKGNLAIIRNHTERANKILSKMMQLGRSENLTRQPTNINRICEDAIEMAYTNMVSSYPGFQCDIKKSYDNGIGEVMAVTQEISMVLLNLLNNAFFSTRQKSATTHGYKPLLSIQTKMKAESNLKQPAVEIIIHDNGTGISSAVKNKIFQPFFTTKSANEGSGLGLSLSSDIIKAHGGELTFSSVENEYAEFIILLPASV
ncbi:MAG: Sensor protein FixL [Bacteroidetes bacterium ADurb.Bin141]|nr:MAG: Sensor protein FixL [Bacteroidetes bacterium ADurb.Bin141]